MKAWSKILLISWIFLSVVVWQIAGKIEGSYYPVVTSTKVIDVVQVSDGVYIYGRFGKLRNCSFESLRADITEDKLYSKITLDFRDKDRLRKMGLQSYGPWFLRIDEIRNKKIRLTAEHKCHIGFNTVTITFLVDVRKNNGK